jgi:hypothetical protein
MPSVRARLHYEAEALGEPAEQRRHYCTQHRGTEHNERE